MDVANYIKSRFSHQPISMVNLQPHTCQHDPESISPEQLFVSIIIPTRDKVELLKACVQSILELTSGLEFELIIVDNQSKLPETFDYFEELRNLGHSILEFNYEFNFSRINNLAVEQAKGDILCFLNNDTQILDRDWLAKLVAHSLDPRIGLVGPILVYPNKLVQHSGLALGYQGIADSGYKGQHLSALPKVCHEVSAISFACTVISKANYYSIGKLDERFSIGLNDVDYSKRALNKGLKNVICVESILEHHEYQSRKKMSSVRGSLQAIYEVLLFLKKYPGPQKEIYFE